MFGFKKKSTKEQVFVQVEKSEKEKGKAFSLMPKSKTAIGILCLVIALLLITVVVPLTESMAFKTVNVVVACADIQKGQVLEQGNFRIYEMSAKNLPRNYLSKTDDAIGRYAIISMLEGDIITSGKLSITIPSENAYLYGLKDGELAISVNINSFAGSLSGKLRQGDIVQIFTVQNESNEAIIDETLSALLVLAVTNSEAQDLDDNTDTDNPQIATITVLANKNQAAKLAALGTNSTLYAALVRRGSEQQTTDGNIPKEEVQKTDEGQNDSLVGQ